MQGSKNGKCLQDHQCQRALPHVYLFFHFGFPQETSIPHVGKQQEDGVKTCPREGGHIPLLVRRGGRAIKKKSISELARTGWSITSQVFGESDHPSAALRWASPKFS